MHKYGKMFFLHYHDYAQKRLRPGPMHKYGLFLVCIIMIMHKKNIDPNLCKSMGIFWGASEPIIESFFVCIIMIMHTIQN